MTQIALIPKLRGRHNNALLLIARSDELRADGLTNSFGYGICYARFTEFAGFCSIMSCLPVRNTVKEGLPAEVKRRRALAPITASGLI